MHSEWKREKEMLSRRIGNAYQSNGDIAYGTYKPTISFSLAAFLHLVKEKKICRFSLASVIEANERCLS